MSRYVGVDGCPGGWFAVALDPESGIDHACFETFDAVVDAHVDVKTLLVDMPIGLPETGRRRCDEAARERLGSRASTVFFAPCRAVLDAADHQEASNLNRERSGYGLSVQAWHLVPKIREVDATLRSSPGLSDRVAEAHPELCFAALGDGPVLTSKSTSEGRRTRLDRLRPWLAERGVDAEGVYDACLDTYHRKDVGRDDVLDALALAGAAGGPLTRVPDVPDDEVPRDGVGLPMEIRTPENVTFNNNSHK